jgi:hypothetical protein
MIYDYLPPRPYPNAAHAKRMAESSLRRRMLYGEWTPDLDSYIMDNIGSVRQRAWGHGDISRCAWLDVATAQASLYDRAPEVKHQNELANQMMGDILHGAGWASMMPRIQRDTIAIREMHLHPVMAPDGRLTLIPAYPSDVEGEARFDDPEALGYAKWHRPRIIEGKQVWTADEYDIRDPRNPSFRVVNQDGDDITDLCFDSVPAGGFVGARYPYRYSGGEAFIPLVTYHAARTGQLYDWSTGCELTEGTLRIGLYYSYYGHVMKNAAWAQRYSVGVDWLGSGTSDPRDGRPEVVADPATVLQGIQDHEQQASPTVGAWAPPVSPSEMLAAVESYTRTVYATAGLSAADISRVSGDPRSGYALAVTRDGQREMQKKYQSQFERGDLELLRMVAAMAGLPDTGWRIRYTALPQSIDELVKIQAFVDNEVAAGRMSQIDAYRKLNPGTDVLDAVAELSAIKTLNEEDNNGNNQRDDNRNDDRDDDRDDSTADDE